MQWSFWTALASAVALVWGILKCPLDECAVGDVKCARLLQERKVQLVKEQEAIQQQLQQQIKEEQHKVLEEEDFQDNASQVTEPIDKDEGTSQQEQPHIQDKIVAKEDETEEIDRQQEKQQKDEAHMKSNTISEEEEFQEDKEEEKNSTQTFCYWKGPIPGRVEGISLGKVLKDDLNVVLNECRREHSNCAGVTSHGENRFQWSAGTTIVPSTSGEMAFLWTCRELDLEPADMHVLRAEPPIQLWEFKGKHPTSVGFKVGEEQSLFVSIASYRDDLCRQTVNDALGRARHPHRLFFGVVEQNLWTDPACVPSKEECDATDEQEPICKHLEQIRLHSVDARLSRGPTLARHKADKLYRGETFLLQIDSHMLFAKDWDVSLEQQFESTQDEFAVLTAYPTRATGSINQVTGESLLTTTPVMCSAELMREGLLRFGGGMELPLNLFSKPVQHPYWAAGLSFSRGHRAILVPYDCCTPQLFMGEEFGMSARLFTHGYNFYAFKQNVIVHFYPFERPASNLPMFWENADRSVSIRNQIHESTDRIKTLVTLNVSTPTNVGVRKRRRHRIPRRYNLGVIRPLDAYFELLGIVFNSDRSEITYFHKSLCHVVRAGEFSFPSPVDFVVQEELVDSKVGEDTQVDAQVQQAEHSQGTSDDGEQEEDIVEEGMQEQTECKSQETALQHSGAEESAEVNDVGKLDTEAMNAQEQCEEQVDKNEDEGIKETNEDSIVADHAGADQTSSDVDGGASHGTVADDMKDPRVLRHVEEDDEDIDFSAFIDELEDIVDEDSYEEEEEVYENTQHTMEAEENDDQHTMEAGEDDDQHTMEAGEDEKEGQTLEDTQHSMEAEEDDDQHTMEAGEDETEGQTLEDTQHTMEAEEDDDQHTMEAGEDDREGQKLEDTQHSMEAEDKKLRSIEDVKQNDEGGIVEEEANEQSTQHTNEAEEDGAEGETLEDTQDSMEAEDAKQNDEDAIVEEEANGQGIGDTQHTIEAKEDRTEEQTLEDTQHSMKDVKQNVEDPIVEEEANGQSMEDTQQTIEVEEEDTQHSMEAGNIESTRTADEKSVENARQIDEHATKERNEGNENEEEEKEEINEEEKEMDTANSEESRATFERELPIEAVDSTLLGDADEIDFDI